MSSPEQAKIVVAEGGDQTIKAVMGAYSDDQQVSDAAKSALLSMEQLAERQARPKLRVFNTEEKYGFDGTDPLKEHRNLLKAGQILTEWGSSVTTKHLQVTPDFKFIEWKNPKKGNKRLNQIAIRDLRVIRVGPYDGSHKTRGKAADPAKAFSIVARTQTLDLEAKSEIEAKRWIDALQRLLLTSKKAPEFLK